MRFIPLRNFYYKYVKSNKYPFYKKGRLDRKVAAMKDIHKGEACFVIGNGPSLTADDLDAIADTGYPSFAANSIFKIFDKTKWRPTYLVYQDQQIIDGLVNMFEELSSSCEKMIIRRDVYNQITMNYRESEKLVLPRLVMHIRKDKYYDFSEDVSKYAYDGCTVTYFSIQLAYYMGFNKIYLIGMDHNFPVMLDENDHIIEDKSVKMHCFDDSKHIVLNPSRVIESTFAYRSAKKFLKLHGVEIYNATRGGRLEEFTRVDADEILKKGNKK